MSELSGFSKGYSMTKKQNVKALIWDLEELPPVERDRGGAWRRQGLTRIPLCTNVLTVNESQDGR